MRTNASIIMLKSISERYRATLACRISVREVIIDIDLLKGERELINYKQKNDSARKFVQEISGRNSRLQDDIEKKAFEIDQTRQDHHMLFKVALETIMRRLKDYEAEQEKKGLHFEKYGHLDKQVEYEQTQILQLNDQIMEVEKQLQDL